MSVGHGRVLIRSSVKHRYTTPCKARSDLLWATDMNPMIASIRTLTVNDADADRPVISNVSDVT